MFKFSYSRDGRLAFIYHDDKLIITGVKDENGEYKISYVKEHFRAELDTFKDNLFSHETYTQQCKREHVLENMKTLRAFHQKDAIIREITHREGEDFDLAFAFAVSQGVVDFNVLNEKILVKTAEILFHAVIKKN